MKVDKKALRQILEEMVPFNKHLGIKLKSYAYNPIRVSSTVLVKDEFIGNVIRNVPHGGLISTIIDATSGTAAMLSLENYEHIARLATIDMRIDFLDAAKTDKLITESVIKRRGRRIIVVSTEVHDELGTLIAIGTNTFNLAV